jgi:hypothetical protein
MCVLLALAIHGPLLLMQLPLNSYDANFHIFFASHYARHWFDPWNVKWFAGFSQTTYPPLVHQWIALLSHLVGLTYAFMLVLLTAIVLLVVGVYRFAKLWVSDRAASYASLAMVFVGTLAFLVYQAGQLPTVCAAALYVNAVPYFYEWSRKASFRALLKGVVLSLAAASVHHVTLIFGSALFAVPVIWLAIIGRENEEDTSSGAIISRALIFAVLVMAGVGVVLLPYWLAILKHPIKQIPIPHASRANLLTNSVFLMNYFIVPYGLMILAFPFILIRGASERRLRPLLVFFWITLIIGLGGTTPLPRWLFGRAFEILTFERFTLLATILALPIAGSLIESLIDRFRLKGVIAASLAATATLGMAFAWLTLTPYSPQTQLNVQSVIAFLNRDDHARYRYLTLGFGNTISKIATYTDANSIDGEYNSARLLPELTHHGSAQLTNAKFFGTAGMESLRAILKHANHYGLKYIFVHDSDYYPLIAFAGWRQVETFDNGQITVWSKEDVPPARDIPTDAMPAPWEGVLWGILPMGSSILAILLVLLLPSRQRVAEPVEFPVPAGEHVYLREAK